MSKANIGRKSRKKHLCFKLRFCAGRAIYFYDNLIENILDNTYLNNSAPYGPNLASFPTFLRFRMYNQTNLKIDINTGKLDIAQLNDSFLIFDSLSQNLEDLVLLEVPTGQPFDKILVFDLLDFFNQTINIENSGLIYFVVWCHAFQ